MEVIALLVLGAVVALAARQQARARREAVRRYQAALAARRQALAQARAAAPSAEEAWAQAQAIGWDRLLVRGELRLIGGAPDPGNAGHELRLVEHPAGSLGDVRVLLATDGTATHEGSALVAIPVPSWLADPLQAAAWTYDDPDHPLRTSTADYAALARRT